MALELTDEVFNEEVVESSQKVLVDFYTSWCGPCKIMAPVIEELYKEYEGSVKITKINVDENPMAAETYNVMSIPTFILFKSGSPAKTIMGAVSKDKLIKLIEEN